MVDELRDDRPRVLVLIGSIRTPSHTRNLAKALGQSVAELGADVSYWEAAEPILPTPDPEFHRDPSKHSNSDVRKLVQLAEDADGFIWASPIYHNSYSGALKNLLDHLAIRNFRYKPVALVGHGAHRSTQAVDHLRVVARGLWAVAIPTQTCTQDSDYKTNSVGEYEVVEPEILERLTRQATELIDFVGRFRRPRA